MKLIFRKQLSTVILVFVTCLSNTHISNAQNFGGKQQLMKDIDALNSVSRDYNAKPATDKSKTEKALSSFESLIGRKLSKAEHTFLSLQLATMNILPTFAVNGNNIEVSNPTDTSKNGVFNVEVINSEKNIFKFNGKTFQLDPNKAIHENIQTMLKELEKEENKK